MADIGTFVGVLKFNMDPKSLNAAQSKIKRFATASRDAINKIGLIGAAAFAAVGAGALKAAQMAGIQEQAQIQLAEAMKQAGTFTEAAYQHNLKYASSLQKLTVYGDEQILVGQRMLTNFGVEGEALDMLTKATLDLASAKGMDLTAAFDLVAKTVGSSTNALTRYGIEVTGAAGSTERAEMAVANITKIFGGAAQAQAGTYLGRITQLKNQWGDIVEKIGFAVIPVINDLMGVIKIGILPAIEKWTSDTESMNKITKIITTSFKIFISIIMSLWTAFKILGEYITTVGAFWVKLFSGDIKGAFDIVKEGFGDMSETIMQGSEDITNSWTKAEEMQTQATKENIELRKKAKKEEGEFIFQFDKDLSDEIRKESTKLAEYQISQREKYARTFVGGFKAAVQAVKERTINWQDEFGGLMNAMTDGFQTNIQAMLTGAKNFGEGISGIFKSLGDAVVSEITRMTAKWLAFTALKGIANIFTGGLFGAVGKIFGFAKGGIVPGPIGAPQLALVHGGETVTPAGRAASTITLNNETNINIQGSIDNDNVDTIAKQLTEAVKNGDIEAIRLAKTIEKEGTARSGESY